MWVFFYFGSKERSNYRCFVYLLRCVLYLCYYWYITLFCQGYKGQACYIATQGNLQCSYTLFSLLLPGLQAYLGAYKTSAMNLFHLFSQNMLDVFKVNNKDNRTMPNDVLMTSWRQMRNDVCFVNLKHILHVNPFEPSVPFLYSLRFSDVFRGYGNETLGSNELIHFFSCWIWTGIYKSHMIRKYPKKLHSQVFVDCFKIENRPTTSSNAVL